MVAVPTNDDLTIINQAAPVDEAGHYRTNIEAAFAETLAMAPDLARRIAKAERVERFRLTTDTQGFFRVPYGPGWALVGDAGYHKDAITAQGMLDAFRDAELLATAIDDGLESNLDDALRSYQQTRDAAVLPMYEFTCGLAHVEQPPPPEMAALIGALAGNPHGISRFLGLIAGSVSVPDFFTAPFGVDPASVLSR